MQLDLFGEPVAAPSGPIAEYEPLDMTDVPFGPVTAVEELTGIPMFSELPEEMAQARDNFFASMRAGTIERLMEEVQADQGMSVLGPERKLQFKAEWLPMIMDKLNGMTMPEIGRKYGKNPIALYSTFNRPVIRKFVAKLLTEYSRDLGDPAERIKFAATEAVDKIITQMRSAAKEETQQKAAFGILRMAGYDERVKLSLTVNDAPLSAAVVNKTEKLLEALHAAQASREIGYNKFVTSGKQQEVEAEFTEIARPLGLKLASGGA